MRLGVEVARILSSKPESITLENFLLKFESVTKEQRENEGQEEVKKARKLSVEERTRRAKAHWGKRIYEAQGFENPHADQTKET